MIVFLNRKYPAEPEEVTSLETELREPWNANNHIGNLFQSIKEGCKTLIRMNAIIITDVDDRTFVKYVYNVIRGSGQFEGACIEWKALPENERQTIVQIRTFFSKKYDIFDAQQNSLHQAGVANSVQFQELQQATTEALISVRDRLEQQDANILQIQSNSNNGGDDSATVFLAMTAHSALKDGQIEDLQVQLRSQQLRSTPIDSTIGSRRFSPAGGSSYSGSNSYCGGSSYGGQGSSGGGGRRSGGGQGNTIRLRRNGPANCTKNTKFYTSSETYCWSCGYDCSKIHGSNTCSYKLQGHQDTATATDTMGGSLKDKEFSK
jgi:hypothetical protein